MKTRNAGMPASSRTHARKSAPVANKAKPSAKEEARATEDQETSEARYEIFKANLPTFHVDCLRGNVVDDSESFLAQSGETYDTFRLAYTRMRHGTKSTMFIKVIAKHVPDFTVAKGNYVEVSGDYSDDGVTPGKDGYAPSVFRTLFMGEDDTCKVLIG